jgi:UDP-N-acetylglucosamine transferase subunit ALG13
MAFDRPIRTVDDWAYRRGRRDVFAQIGPSDLRPRVLEWTQNLPPAEFDRRMKNSDAVVAHAGMGSILKALQHGKPILVMPRRGSLMETRNDHQVATAERLSSLGYVSVAMDEEALFHKLDGLQALDPSARIPPFASAELLGALQRFIARG